MKLIVAFGLSLLVVSLLIRPAFSEPVRLVTAYLSDADGAPLAGQPLVVEGKSRPPAWIFKQPGAYWWTTNKPPVRVVGVTDRKGFIQFVDLPPGEYDMKLIRAGVAALTIKKILLDADYTSVKFDVVLKPEGTPVPPSEKLPTPGRPKSIEMR